MTRRWWFWVAVVLSVLVGGWLLRRWWVAQALENDRLRRQTAAAQQLATTWQQRYQGVIVASVRDSVVIDSLKREATKDSTAGRAAEHREGKLRIQLQASTSKGDSLTIALAGWAAADERASSWERTALNQMQATATAERDRDRWKQLVADTAAGADRTIGDLRQALADEAKWRENTCKIICIRANGTVAVLAAAGGAVVGWLARGQLDKK